MPWVSKRGVGPPAWFLGFEGGADLDSVMVPFVNLRLLSPPKPGLGFLGFFPKDFCGQLELEIKVIVLVLDPGIMVRPLKKVRRD